MAICREGGGQLLGELGENNRKERPLAASTFHKAGLGVIPRYTNKRKTTPNQTHPYHDLMKTGTSIQYVTADLPHSILQKHNS